MKDLADQRVEGGRVAVEQSGEEWSGSQEGKMEGQMNGN